jgi:hypothetical protein
LLVVGAPARRSTSSLGDAGANVTQVSKTTFLAVHDCGMGGIWILIDAESSEQIERLYPQLKVVNAPPSWLNDEQMDKIRQNLHFDIDAPAGWLLSLNRRAER